jgi:carbon storage regulator CsrA
MLVLSRRRNQKVVIQLDTVIKQMADFIKGRIEDGACLEKVEEELLHDYGDSVEIAVVEIRGDKARLGIKASKLIPVHREEVYVKIGNGGKE